jgi:TM2 domain-containing membrane protein YozV
MPSDIKIAKFIVAGIGAGIVYPLFGLIPAFWFTLAGCFLYSCFRPYNDP